MKKTLLLFAFLASCVNCIFAQEIKYFGAPFITQYLPKDYDASPQNWDIAQDKRGVMYVGSTDALLEFDGVNWRKYYVENKSAIRSLDIDSIGNIWVGAFDEFGYFTPDSLGDLTYHSLSEQLPDSIQNFANIWQTLAVPSGVYFFSKTKFFRWYGGKLTVVNTAVQTYFTNKAFNEVYVWDKNKTLCLLKDTTLIPLLNEEQRLKIAEVGGYKNMCEYQDHKLLIATGKNGFFIYDIKSQILSQPEIDPQIIAYSTQNRGAYSLSKINDDAYALGTIKGGVLVLNAKFELTDVVNTMRGLQSNTIYTLFTDQNEDLWAGLPNGLARIEINNPLRSFGEKQNMNAFGLDAVTFEGKKYVATMNGFFVLDKYELSLEDDNQKFTYLPNLDNCWDLHLYKNKLFAAGRFGVSQIVNGKAKQLFNKDGDRALSMQTSKRYPNHLFVGYRDDFVAIELVKQSNSEYLAIKEVIHFPNIVGEVRTITEDKNGDLWLGKHSDGAVFIQFAGNTDILDYKMHFLDKKNGLPSNKMVTVVTINNGLSFLTGRGIYKLTDETQTISSSTQFEPHDFWKMYSENDSVRYKEFFKLAENSYVLTGEFIAFLRKEKDSVVANEVPFAKVEGLTNLIIEQNNINVCTVNSFYTYNLNKDSIRTNKTYNTLIRKVSIGQDSLIFNGSFYNKNGNRFEFTQFQGREQIPVLDYINNSIKIHFSAAFYDASKKITYSYLLEGFNNKWSNWSKETNAIFTNVPEGDYTFQIKSKNIYDVESTITNYQFEILPPWYRTVYAYVFYFIFLVGFIWGIVKLNTRRLIKEKIKLESIIKERTEEVQQQKEEILSQNEELMQANEEVSATSEALISQNTELEKSYNNVQLLSVIGQKITSKLAVENIIETVYQQVNLLMDAEVFAIGILNTSKQRLDFYGTKEREETLPYNFDELANDNKLSVYCFKNFSTILLKDFDAEITNYLAQKSIATAGASTNSLIYLPLGSEDKKIGVITVQSSERNAYTEYHLNILRNIAIYTEIALENADVYLQISEQHDKIKDQHYQIKSSLNYASTIQNAILPARKSIDKLFENFIIYRPKDIVSGDFYWMNEIDNTIFIAAVDCTGHGVPGAFMSMIGSRLLNNIVSQRKIMETDAILEALHVGVKKALRQEQTNNTDGMDICLCKIEKNDSGTNIYFTGAKSPLFVYQQDKTELLKIRGDKKEVGGNHFDNLNFTQTKLVLQKGDTIYLTTDGFVDQNNKERKKFTTTKLMNLLHQIQGKSLSMQRNILENKLDNWQGKEEQRDDITILGIRI